MESSFSRLLFAVWNSALMIDENPHGNGLWSLAHSRGSCRGCSSLMPKQISLDMLMATSSHRMLNKEMKHTSPVNEFTCAADRGWFNKRQDTVVGLVFDRTCTRWTGTPRQQSSESGVSNRECHQQAEWCRRLDAGSSWLA